MSITIPNNMHPHDTFLVEGLKSIFNDLDSGRFGVELKDVTFIVTDAPGWICEAGVTLNTIRVNLKVLQVFYMYCSAYHTYYEKVCKGVQPKGQFISIAERPELSIVRSMLTWSTNNLTAKEDSNCWDNIAFPIPGNNSNDFVFQLFIGALSFYVLHEAMHLTLGMVPSKEEEEECDLNAAAILLGDGPSDKEARTKGVAVGLTLMNALGMHTGNYDGTTHPFAYDRLISCLSPHCDHDRDNVWDWVVALFALHMTENKIEQPKEEFGNFYDCVVRYREILHAHHQNSTPKNLNSTSIS